MRQSLAASRCGACEESSAVATVAAARAAVVSFMCAGDVAGAQFAHDKHFDFIAGIEINVQFKEAFEMNHPCGEFVELDILTKQPAEVFDLLRRLGFNHRELIFIVSSSVVPALLHRYDLCAPSTGDAVLLARRHEEEALGHGRRTLRGDQLAHVQDHRLRAEAGGSLGLLRVPGQRRLQRHVRLQYLFRYLSRAQRQYRVYRYRNHYRNLTWTCLEGTTWEDRDRCYMMLDRGDAAEFEAALDAREAAVIASGVTPLSILAEFGIDAVAVHSATWTTRSRRAQQRGRDPSRSTTPTVCRGGLQALTRDGDDVRWPVTALARLRCLGGDYQFRVTGKWPRMTRERIVIGNAVSAVVACAWKDMFLAGRERGRIHATVAAPGPVKKKRKVCLVNSRVACGTFRDVEGLFYGTVVSHVEKKCIILWDDETDSVVPESHVRAWRVPG